MGFVIATILLLFSLIFAVEAWVVWDLSPRISAQCGLVLIAIMLLMAGLALLPTLIF